MLKEAGAFPALAGGQIPRALLATAGRLPARSSMFSPADQALTPTVKKFADEVVAPRVMEMDENEKMDPAIIKGLFEQGVRLSRSFYPRETA